MSAFDMERYFLPKPDFVNTSLEFTIAGFDKHVSICTMLIPLKSGDYQCAIFTDKLEFLSFKEVLEKLGVPFSGTVSLVSDWSIRSQFSALEQVARDQFYIRKICLGAGVHKPIPNVPKPKVNPQ